MWAQQMSLPVPRPIVSCHGDHCMFKFFSCLMHKVSATAASSAEVAAGPSLDAAGSADGTTEDAGPQDGEQWCGWTFYKAGCTFHRIDP